MRGDLLFPLPLLWAFLLVLVRIGGVLVFLPIPGAHAGPAPARVVLILMSTIALFPCWPHVPADPGTSLMVVWIVAEAGLGIFAGVLLSYLAEALTLGAQILSLQAGYAYASTIDPNTQADSGILVVLAQLLAGMLFFAAGLDRLLFSAFAASLGSYPPGTFALSRPLAGQLIQLGSCVFSLAFRIALPVVGLLLMVDVALGILGRINAQLQVISLAFPAKMMLTLIMLALLSSLFPVLFESHASLLLKALQAALAPG